MNLHSRDLQFLDIQYTWLLKKLSNRNNCFTIPLKLKLITINVYMKMKGIYLTQLKVTFQISLILIPICSRQ